MTNLLTQPPRKQGTHKYTAMDKSFRQETHKTRSGSGPYSEQTDDPATTLVGNPAESDTQVSSGNSSSPDWYPYHAPDLVEGTRTVSYFGGALLTLFIFMALPITQLLSDRHSANTHTVLENPSIPPPPSPPPEPPPEEEEVADEDVPELQEEVLTLDLNQLDVALNPGVGDALNIGSAILGFGITPDTIAQMDIFELQDLDNDPQRIVAVAPIYPFQFKRDGINGWVKLIIIINEKGKVIKADVQGSSHREFENPGIEAVLQWRFEPGTKNGKAVKVRRLQPISFKLR